MLRVNIVADTPVTTKDIMLAKNIFSPDVGALKVKTTCQKPFPVVQNYIEILKELTTSQSNVTLSIDAFKVNGLVFLTSMSRNLQYRAAQFVKNQTPMLIPRLTRISLIYEFNPKC
jgi:hypothetical protein